MPYHRNLLSRLPAKTAIVTGGGRGIGRAIVHRLVSAGANVLACDLDQQALQETQASARNSERVALICGDLMEPAFPQQIVDAALEAFGSIDIIVNCAGFSWDSVIQKTIRRAVPGDVKHPRCGALPFAARRL